MVRSVHCSRACTHLHFVEPFADRIESSAYFNIAEEFQDPILLLVEPLEQVLRRRDSIRAQIAKGSAPQGWG